MGANRSVRALFIVIPTPNDMHELHEAITSANLIRINSDAIRGGLLLFTPAAPH
jgi:hypothetical protein